MTRNFADVKILCLYFLVILKWIFDRFLFYKKSAREKGCYLLLGSRMEIIFDLFLDI